MLALGFGDWTFWEDYTPPAYFGAQQVTFDGPNKLILVNDGVTELDFRVDVYSAWKEWQLDPNHVNSRYAEAITSIGGDTLPGSRALGTTYFLENGWRMRTWEGDHELTVTGNVFTREGESLFVSTLFPWTITINLNTSTLVETILPEIAIDQTTINEIASQTANTVWNGTVSGANTALDILLAMPDNVWDEIIDVPKSQTARDKLAKIATKVQDIALS